MKILTIIGVLCILSFLIVSVSGYCYLENKHKVEINAEMQDYNNLLKEYISENPYELGDKLKPIKRMVK